MIHSVIRLLLLTMLAGMSVTAIAETYTIGVIGTGRMGSALGVQFAEDGHTVVYGSRDPARDSVRDLVALTGSGARATTQKDAAQSADIIVLAVPSNVVPALIPTLGDLSGKIIIDITTAFQQGDDGYPEYSIETTTGERIQALAPEARVVKTPFAGAETVRDPARYGEPALTWIASDDRAAKKVVARLALGIGFFPLDAGPLRMGRSIDHTGLLYLTPLMQGRPHTWSSLPRVDLDLSCVDSSAWYASVSDADDLPAFPNLDDVTRLCPDGPPPK